VLVGPGDYKTTPSAVSAPAGHPEFPADVLITTPHLLLRGMSRGSVVIDGTKPGSPQCASAAGDQNYGPAGSGGNGPLGINGVEV
jgi:hypothetical protein